MIDYILGRYRVPDEIDVEKLKEGAVQLHGKETRRISSPLKPGLYLIAEDDEQSILLRTRIGLFFPSPYKVSIGKKVQFVPPLSRVAFGIIGIVVILLALLVTIILFAEEARGGALSLLLMCATLVFFGLLIEAERQMVLFGFKRLSR